MYDCTSYTRHSLSVINHPSFSPEGAVNKVFHSQLRKARGVFHFSKAERQVLAAAGVISLVAAVAVQLFLGIGVFVALAASMVIHRRADNHRADHLEILFRRLFMRPAWSLCEDDSAYVRYEHEDTS